MNGTNINGLAASPAAALTSLGGNAPIMASDAFAPLLAQAALGGGNLPGFAVTSLPQGPPATLLNQTNLLSFWPTSTTVKEGTALADQQLPSEDVPIEISSEEKESRPSEQTEAAAAGCLQAIQQILAGFSSGSTLPPISKDSLAQVTEFLTAIPDLTEQLKPNQIQELQTLLQGIAKELESMGKSNFSPTKFTLKDDQNSVSKPIDFGNSEFAEAPSEDSPMVQLSQKLKSLFKESNPDSLMENGQAFVKPQETVEQNTPVSSQPVLEMVMPLASTEPIVQVQAHPKLEKVMAMPAALRENVFEQVVRSMNFSIKEGQSEMQIHLKPDYLGQMSMKIAVEDGLVAASFTVENQQVKELLESSLSNLRQSLTNQGLKVDTLTVSIGSGGAFSNLSQRQSNWGTSTSQGYPAEEYREAETEIAQVKYDGARSWSSTGSMDYIV